MISDCGIQTNPEESGGESGVFTHRKRRGDDNNTRYTTAVKVRRSSTENTISEFFQTPNETMDSSSDDFYTDFFHKVDLK